MMAKNGNFLGFFLIFSEMVLCKALRFFALTSVHQDASLELSKSNIGQFFCFVSKGGPL